MMLEFRRLKNIVQKLASKQTVSAIDVQWALRFIKQLEGRNVKENTDLRNTKMDITR
jgi:hypothetical protein